MRQDDVKPSIRRISLLLDRAALLFDKLDTENFDSVYPQILGAMAETKELKENLLNEHPLEELMIFEPVLAFKTKLIREKYDNTVGAFSREGKKLEKQIGCLLRKKKLINYQRYENGNQGPFKKYNLDR